MHFHLTSGMNNSHYYQGRTRGGDARPHYACPPEVGGARMWGAFLILHHTCLSLPQEIYILHCIAFTQTKRLRKEINYILIHNKALPDQVLH